MGATILQSLAQRRDGLLLFESFESPNFTLDQGWTVLNGTPTTSNAVAHDALNSLVMDSTCPLIQYQPGSYFTCAAGWFYDDATKTTQAAIPAIVLKDSAGASIFGIGVNNAVSTTNYSILTAAGTWVASTITRTTAWHRWSYSLDASSNPHLYIGNLDTGVALGAGVLCNTIQVGCQANTGDGFGWFDQIQVCANQFVTMYNLTDPQGLVVVCAGSAPQALSSSGIAQVDMAFTDSPFDAYLVVTNLIQQAGMTLDSAPLYQSDVNSFSAGDIYFLNQFRFDRRVSSLSPVATQSRTDTLSLDGVKQSVFFYDVDKVTLVIDGITDDQRNDLLSWWTTAKRGEVFSVAVDEDDIYLDYTQQAVTAFPTGQLVLAYPPRGAGKRLVVQSSDGTIKESVKVASSTFNATDGFWHVNLAAPQAEAVGAGLQVRGLNYWPFCTVESTAFNVSLKSVQVKRWMLTISFMETVQNQPFMAFAAGLGRV